MSNKRHAKTTAAALAERTYRKVLKFHSTLLNQMAHIRLDIAAARGEDREHMKTLIDHCARLLREKETLQRQLYAVKELKDSAAMASKPMEGWPFVAPIKDKDRGPVFWCDQHLSYCVKISDNCHRLAHANSCSNQNVLRDEGMFEGASECGCRHWGPT